MTACGQVKRQDLASSSSPTQKSATNESKAPFSSQTIISNQFEVAPEIRERTFALLSRDHSSEVIKSGQDTDSGGFVVVYKDGTTFMKQDKNTMLFYNSGLTIKYLPQKNLYTITLGHNENGKDRDEVDYQDQGNQHPTGAGQSVKYWSDGGLEVDFEDGYHLRLNNSGDFTIRHRKTEVKGSIQNLAEAALVEEVLADHGIDGVNGYKS
ncbi:hypothetical protein D3X11_04310 [Streptococcus sp. X16XC17]|uniref:hypothetical protein n=1 Tax=unclassified Streptococcus TaxID=2608887 RepID=UPI00066FF3DD|nr:MULTISPECIES: hypothetical protein [unclassified Streptococcus]TCD46610.1 hypothetical protein D3X11_04310 [Streptococcus sp. X16XC17]